MACFSASTVGNKLLTNSCTSRFKSSPLCIILRNPRRAVVQRLFLLVHVNHSSLFLSVISFGSFVFQLLRRGTLWRDPRDLSGHSFGKLLCYNCCRSISALLFRAAEQCMGRIMTSSKSFSWKSLIKCQNTVVFVTSHDVVSNGAFLAVKYATLETIRRLRAFLVAISSQYLTVLKFFNGQHINQAVQVKTGW